MITTATGAKKLESSDNWREIFPNSTLSTPGAHNASVDAADRIQAEVAPIINGKQCAVGAAEGEYVLLRNSTITGKTDGAYKAVKAIPANTNIDSTYLGSPITGGISNDINNNVTPLNNAIFGYNEIYGSAPINNLNNAEIGYWYKCYGSASNMPKYEEGMLFTIGKSNGTEKFQFFAGQTIIATRYYGGGSWSAWKNTAIS